MTALPPSWPGYQASTTAATLLSHGISTGPPVFKTTTVRGLAAATAAIKASWSPGKERSRRSKASLLKSLANTTATWAERAARAAAAMSLDE